MTDIQTKWDRRYNQSHDKPKAASVLVDYSYLLPTKGEALDLACGRGGNALFLAEQGLQVEAWDISPVAIAQLNQSAKEKQLPVDGQVRDVILDPPQANSIDVLVVSLFLERSLCPKLISALKPGGILFYQTYCQKKIIEQGPNNPNYLLADNELLQLFSALKVRIYHEDAQLGNPQKGIRNQALLIAEKV